MEMKTRKSFGFLRASVMVLLASLTILTSSVWTPSPAMALGDVHVLSPMMVATMSNKSKATAKDAEGKLESAYGDLTGDTGHQVKGKAKQVQASAMNAGSDIKEGAKSAAKAVGDAAREAGQ